MRNFIVSSVELVILILLMIIPIPFILVYCILNIRKSPILIYNDYLQELLILLKTYYNQ